MILMIDNYDSFTYNLVQYLGELGAEVTVYRNDALTLADIEQLNPDKIVISPGPCTPNEAGIALATIIHFADKLPILGVCLGHQCIAQAFGGKVVRAQEVMHGKTSPVYHNGQGVFAHLPNPFTVARYHSLIAEQATLPACLTVTAWTQAPDGSKGEIMGLKHNTFAIQGVQFHPESILTEYGHQLLRNFCNSSR